MITPFFEDKFIARKYVSYLFMNVMTKSSYKFIDITIGILINESLIFQLGCRTASEQNRFYSESESVSNISVIHRA